MDEMECYHNTKISFWAHTCAKETVLVGQEICVLLDMCRMGYANYSSCGKYYCPKISWVSSIFAFIVGLVALWVFNAKKSSEVPLKFPMLMSCQVILVWFY